ncbi:MAG: hypothetical protein R3E50_14425 [Halioglobus sp.]
MPTVPGLMIMANDDIEAFDNVITGNQSIGVLVVEIATSTTYLSPGRRTTIRCPRKSVSRQRAEQQQLRSPGAGSG